ncbi:hypothetical protein HK104_008009, partial [Borealophlyctis nickersoniae]
MQAGDPPPPADAATVVYSHQVAGHVGQIIVLDDGVLAKQCVQKEVDFYEAVQDAKFTPLRRFLPTYHGHATLSVAGKPSLVVRLENLLAGFTSPSVADVKIGTRLYGSEATDAKRARMEEQARITTSGECGLRICGMKIHDPLTNTITTHTKPYGRSLTPSTLPSGFRTFFTVPSTNTLVNPRVISAIRD